MSTERSTYTVMVLVMMVVMVLVMMMVMVMMVLVMVMGYGRLRGLLTGTLERLLTRINSINFANKFRT